MIVSSVKATEMEILLIHLLLNCILVPVVYW